MEGWGRSRALADVFEKNEKKNRKKNADFNMLQDILNSELEKVSNWLMANELTVNIKTINYVIFKARQKQLSKLLNVGHIASF